MSQAFTPSKRRDHKRCRRYARERAEDRRKGLLERAWLDRFLALQPAKAAVLDIGCGSGKPIGQYLGSGLKRAEHHQRIDIPEFRVMEGLRQTTNDLKAQGLP
jgi:hypothetical protein